MIDILVNYFTVLKLFEKQNAAMDSSAANFVNFSTCICYNSNTTRLSAC